MTICVFFLTSALALHPVFFTEITRIHPDPGGRNGSKHSRQFFWREWLWLHDLLKQKYPDNEFMIIPVKYEETPPGWLWVPFGWRSHLIYRRPLPKNSA